MSSDSQDSEGEDLSTIRPSLIRELRNILDLYPDDGQILKELIQNAEDAGASVVKVLRDERTFHQQVDQRTLRKHPHLKFFKGPALCVYNDAEFTDRDWEGIRMLHTSIKEQDPLKVGRFGLGFKSVFHLTDRLVILSGEHIMYMDPFKGEDRYCNWRRAAGRQGRELQSLLHSLQGVFGVTEATFRADGGRFAGTLFWFPLRQSPSDLSSTVYAERNVEDLLASFRAEAPSLLLFLNHIQRVDILVRDAGSGPREVFSVGVAPSCLQAVRSERARFVRELTSAGGSLPRNETFCVTEVTMETRNHVTGETDAQRWLVASYHCGQREVSRALSQLCSDPQLSYRPYVGVAIPLTSQDSFQSQVFCFLPLPLDTRSPTGLPLHVHGFFALEQNRRHLKWPTADQMCYRGQLDPQSTWNCLLVTELLPKVCHRAFLGLRELNAYDPETFYRAWPDVDNVRDRWKPLLKPLYTTLAQQPSFFSHTRGGQWVSLHQAVLQRFTENFSPEVKEAVVKLYSLNQENLVKLPERVHKTLQEFGLLGDVQVIQAARVSQLIPSCLRQLTRSDRLHLLHYLCCYRLSLVLDLALMPLADGVTFETFRSRQSGWFQTKFWCSNELLQLFSGLEAEFCDNNVTAEVREDLRRLAESGDLSLVTLHGNDSGIPALLQRSLQTRFGTATPTLAANDRWIERVWQFLTTSVPSLAAFTNVPLLPTKKTERNTESIALLPLNGVYVCSEARGMVPLSSALASALTRLGVTVLHGLPDYVTGHRQVLGTFVNYPSTEGVLKAVSRAGEDPKLIKTFNSSATVEEKTALVQLLGDSRDACSRLPSVFHRLRLFTVAGTKRFASVDEVSRIGPDDLPPVALPASLLACSLPERRAALRLGATETTLQKVVEETLEQMSSEFSQYSTDDVIKFMKYFLQHKGLMTVQWLQDMAREVRFVRTESGQLKRADEVYDPSSSVLQELFHLQENMFPHGEFSQPEMLKRLKKLGLRTEKDVKQEDLICTAKKIFEIWSRHQKPAAKKISESLWKYLKLYGNFVSASALKSISTIQCIPCLQDGEKPRDYPGSLPLRSSPALVSPSELSSYSLLPIIGSVVPVLKPEMKESVASLLQVAQKAQPQDVLQHLQVVVQHFRPQEVSQYKFILNEIFRFLGQYTQYPWVIDSLKQEKCVLVDSGDTFAGPNSFWIDRRQGDIDLKPYRFPMPVEMMALSGLLRMCGSSQNQNDQLLHSVLAEIESKYQHGIPQPDDFRTDFQLVKQILDVLKRNSTARDRNTLLPIAHDLTNVLRFKPAKDCTVMPVPGRSPVPAIAGGETYFYVHPDIATSTALELGALPLNDRALTGVEDLDCEYGQHEDLTSRIHGLLEESYTDGFSVPKELIQNADDARASKVCFLLDERENPGARTHLIADTMADLQGPAVWVYNDAVFSDADFDNIIKLGGRTKEDDATKVGKFGLGFNTVYNLTDVPCFLSRSTLAMFDPQRRYLAKGAGMKLDFTKPINRNLLATMPDQFQPFQNVFGCTLRAEAETSYNGTLFRFPLRTSQQAVDNKLKSDSYSETKRRNFLKMLLERAGNLLMFTQSVREVQVFHLPSNCSDPRNAECLLTCSNTCAEPPVVIQPHIQLGNKTILQFMKEQWSKNSDIKIQQKIRIDMIVTEKAEGVCGVKKGSSVTQWQLAWASGVDKSANMANLHGQEGLVPLAAVAISLSEDGIKALKNSPQGFYNTGHLFCFLPLPEEMARVTLPVHVNGTFALTSDRRGLMVQTEDDLGSGKSSWNSALYEDAVSRAYLLLLELVKKEAAADADFGRYFDLWPRTSVPRLVDSFYRRLESDHNKVLPLPRNHEWVTFSDARFLQPEFRDTGCGKVAWETLQKFWKGPGHLVDVPSPICKLMADKGPPKSFEAKVVTEVAFYRDFLFPNLHDDWWQPEHRDILIHHALMQNDKKINELITNYACIPCEGGKLLRKPSELIHPRGRVAALFLTSEGRFPQMAVKDKKETKGTDKSNRIDFCDFKTLQRLSSLGMVTDEMPWDMVLERAQSVIQLNEEKKPNESLSRASNLIEYLSASKSTSSEFAFENCPSEVKRSLSYMAFLPVLSQPTDWPFPWAGPRSTNERLLAPPAELFSDSLKNLVACEGKLLDSKPLHETTLLLTGRKREVLKTLGVFMEEDYSHPRLLGLATMQLVVVAEHHKQNTGNNKELVHSISSDVYAYLTRCVNRDETGGVQEHIRARLSGKDIVWVGSEFVQPSLVAFRCLYDCSPYLFRLEESLQRHSACFSVVGVKTRFEASDVLSALEKVNRDNDQQQLSDNLISLVSRLAQLLGDIGKALPPTESFDTTRVLLPDRHGVMQPSSCLCVDDNPQLRESDRMKFVSDEIPIETARLLGVKTKKRQDYDTLAEPINVEPFGQNEKLTTRIKRLLQGYTFDSSVCKELLQNADDAGATESKFIMDFRHLGTDTVLENWEELQGPALCFYNNKSFTRQDMHGIQNLGIGSKAQDALKIGQFGVGFNAVFHITDVPSFWTKEDDEKDVICVLDPNCQYVLNTEPNKPGAKFTDMERLKGVYPDFVSGYLNNAIDMTQSGTLFRFPLRTAHMANISEIKKEPVTESAIKDLLDEFKKEMSTCLLFLNNLQRVGIYSVNKDGSLKQEFEVNKTVDDLSSQHFCVFQASLQQASNTMQQGTTSLKDIPTFETVVHSKLVDSRGHEERWLSVHRVGFAEDAGLSQKLQDEWRHENFRLLPRGGVAVKLGEQTREKSTQYQVCCILPLPVYTDLPMHVNGHFALDHETRRNLWESGKHEKDVKSEWNSAIALQVIVPAYITALQHAKDVLFPEDGKDLDETLIKSKLQQFHDMFPQPSTLPEFWKELAHEVYRTIAKDELQVFPVSCVEQPGLVWMSAVAQGGFPGYFNNLVRYFEAQKKKREPSRPVVLSVGITSSGFHSTTNEPNPTTLAKELQVLLKKLNMKILEAPFHLYDNFIQSGVEDVQQVTPQTVLQFLRSAGQGISGACNIDSLPQPVANTPLTSAHNVKILVSFVSEGAEIVESLDGLPLCLRQSKTLHKFCSAEDTAKPIISKFSYLLPGSAEEFLHENILPFFGDSEPVQAVLQKLTIPMLASRLKLTLTDPCFSAGQPCVLEQTKLPTKMWLRDLWKFIETQLKEKKEANQTRKEDAVKTDLTQFRLEAGESLQSLNEWCLIPVKKKEADREKSMLYPIKDLHRVIYLSANCDHSNSLLGNILKGFPLPLLDSLQLPALCIANELVASISRPRGLLHALACCADSLVASHKDGFSILTYFDQNLDVLEDSSADKAELILELRRLPVFPVIDGSLVSLTETVPILCLQKKVPKEGLVQWSQDTSRPARLLRKNCVPEALLKYLGFKALATAEFYSQYLLPTLEALPREAIFSHVEFLKDNFRWDTCDDSDLDEESKQLRRQLKSAAFIDVHGILHRAQEFFSPHECVFRAMCSPQQFPPQPFCNTDWNLFMIAAGMISEVTTSMFLDFARTIENGGEREITEEVINKSEILVHHLFKRKTLDQDWHLLSQLKDIRFLPPSLWRSDPASQCLASIAQPFCPHRLVSYAESCFEQHLNLVWSTSCVLHPVADPRTRVSSNHMRSILNQLHLQENAPKDKVIQHVRNVFQALGGDGGRAIFTSLQPNGRLLNKVMEDIYGYLEDCINNDDVASLKHLPVICDIDNMQMLKPANVVIDLLPTERIKGHIENAPHCFGKHFPLFKRLGTTELVSADHYALVLSWLKTESENEQLHVQELKVVRSAIKGLFFCLKQDAEEQNRITVSPLYLPTEEQTLQKSTEIIFKDSIFGSRLTERPEGMRFFLGFKKLELDVHTPVEEVKLLPEEHRMVMLSRIVKEVIPDAIREIATEGECSRGLIERLQHPNVVGAIIRLVYYEHYMSDRPFSVEHARRVKDALSNVSVLETANLKTVLKLHDQPVHGSEKEKSSFTHKIWDTPKKAVVYVDTEGSRRTERFTDITVHSLALAVKFVLETHLNDLYLNSILKSPAMAMEILDNFNIFECNFGSIADESVFPVAGTFVPLHHHCYLDNNFSEFDKNEHVGYEVYDPDVEYEESEDSNAVYIYAIVIEEVLQNREVNVSLFSRRYRIYLGVDRGEAEVSVTTLYKFVRRRRRSTSTEVVEYEGQTGAQDHDFPSDIRAVLREIRQILTDAWQQLSDQRDRRRVMKRLLLKWHPDKNPGNEEFCKRVTQNILQYIDQLNDGKTLSEDDEDDTDGSFQRSGSTSSAFSSTFYAHMNARARSHRADYDSDSSYSRQARSPNPQPGEGHRWFRQAQADVAAARAARETCDKGRNWICYQCHQAAEKAMKAVIYHRDSNYASQSHVLPQLARYVDDSVLLDLAQQLEGRLGSHTRMRYPDVLVYPRIPADVYSDDDCAWACDVTTQVVQRVRSLIQC